MLNIQINITVHPDERPSKLEQSVLTALSGLTESSPAMYSIHDYPAEPKDPETAYFPQDGGTRPEPDTKPEDPAVNVEPEPETEPEAKPEPVKAAPKRAVRRRTPAKAAPAPEETEKPAPEPEPSPEPAEPQEDQQEAEDETPAVLEDEPTDGPTKEDAVSAATKLLSEKKQAVVKRALVAVNAKRVSEVETKDVQKFLDALDDAENDVL